MSEAQSNEAQAEATAKKAKTEYFKVQMADGREVEFAGKRKMDKTILIEGGEVKVRFDFRNGVTHTLNVSELKPEIQLNLLGHGASQKCGDSAAGEETVEDMALSVEKTVEQLRQGSWSVARTAGDSFRGGSVVIKALCEVTGKPVDAIKAFIDKTIEAKKVSRQALYASFRADARVGPVIERLEKESAKPSNVDTGGLLDEISAG